MSDVNSHFVIVDQGLVTFKIRTPNTWSAKRNYDGPTKDHWDATRVTGGWMPAVIDQSTGSSLMIMNNVTGLEVSYNDIAVQAPVNWKWYEGGTRTAPDGTKSIFLACQFDIRLPSSWVDFSKIAWASGYIILEMEDQAFFEFAHGEGPPTGTVEGFWQEWNCDFTRWLRESFQSAVKWSVRQYDGIYRAQAIVYYAGLIFDVVQPTLTIGTTFSATGDWRILKFNVRAMITVNVPVCGGR